MTGGLVTSSISTALASSAAVLIAAVGELLVERVGVYNLGVEGMMLLGGLAGFVVTLHTGSILLGIAAAMATGAVAALIFGVAVCVLGAQMVMAGLAMWFIGVGITGQLGTGVTRASTQATMNSVHIPGLSDIPYLGPAVFREPVIVYVALVLPLIVLVLYRNTRHGLNMRSIGEDPHTADAVGIPVIRWQLIYIAIGGALAGLGGSVITLVIVRTWLPGVTSGQGWIAIAVVIFAGWQPVGVLLGGLLFGALGTLGDVAQTQGWNVSSEFLSALPYVGTLAVLITTAGIRSYRHRSAPWPAALGVPFSRGS